MKQTILDYLKQEEGKKYSIKELSKNLAFTSTDDYKELAKTINALEEQALIIANSKNKYTLIEFTPYEKGILDVKDKGFGFLKIDDSDDDDIYVPKNKIQGAMNNDHVLVLVDKSPKGLRKEGEVIRVLARNYTHIIGTVVKRGKHFNLISDDKSIKMDIEIKETDLNGAKVFDKVKALITNYAFNNRMQCRVIEVIGNINDSGVDVLSKILKHNVDPVFPEEVIQYAAQFKTLEAAEYDNREDYRDRMIITIDGDDAKDFDDAIEVYKKDNGNYYLGVHIADVSYYVHEHSVLDQEALNRATSIYLVDRVIPMLPENLSNNLCSLMPDVDRFAMSCEMEIDSKGSVKSHRIFPSVINSKARMTYNKANDILAGDEKLSKEYDFLGDMFQDSLELSKILNKKRNRMGSINFETDEPYIKLDQNGKAIDVLLRERGQSERIIEEFMLIANQTVAAHVFWMELPFIYRVHEAPKAEKLEKLLTMANALGFKVKGKSEISHKELQKLLQKVENTTSEKGMNLMMLRSMQKAIYTKENIGHFGLAFEHYTHFTSPIRRYPDLMVHRMLREYYFNNNKDTKMMMHFDQILDDVAKQSSEKERNAVMLEREVLDMKKAEYMAPFIGETFEGYISGVTSFGLYVSLPNTVEGLVHITELDDDFYEFDEDLMFLIGRHQKKMYRLGAKVKVKLTSVNIFDGEIDFKIVGEKHENNRKQ